MTWAIGSHRSQSQHIAAQVSQKFNMCDFVASTQAFVAKAGIDCDHWCPYIERHRAPSCVLLTHVWKPAFIGLGKQKCWTRRFEFAEMPLATESKNTSTLFSAVNMANALRATILFANSNKQNFFFGKNSLNNKLN